MVFSEIDQALNQLRVGKFPVGCPDHALNHKLA